MPSSSNDSTSGKGMVILDCSTVVIHGNDISVERLLSPNQYQC